MTATAFEALLAALILLGALFVFIGSLGLARLRDFFTRLHGPTKATTLGVGSLLLASLLHFSSRGDGISLHEGLVTLFLFITAPVSGHLLAKTALHLRLRSLAPVPPLVRQVEGWDGGEPLAPGTQQPPPASALGRVHRLAVADYHRMGETGILGPDLRTELIDGEIIEMSPIGHPHAGTVKLLAHRLHQAVGQAAIISVQDPIWLDDHSEPLPDLALLRPRPDFYRAGHPRPADVLLLIEVADTSLTYDQEIKLPRYALAGIPEVWLVDLSNRRLLIHRTPAAGQYLQITCPATLTQVPLPVGDGRPVDLGGLFGP